MRCVFLGGRWGAGLGDAEACLDCCFSSLAEPTTMVSPASSEAQVL